MKTKLLVFAIACALLFGARTAHASPYVVALTEVGSNVVATGSGSIDLTGLVFSNLAGGSPAVYPVATEINIGPVNTNNLVYYTATLSGPTSFGSGGLTTTTIGTGDFVGFSALSPFGCASGLCLPLGYTSDTPLSGTATYANATIASLGITPGTYTWTWGPGADQSFTITTTPLPAALPLFATGLSALGLLGWRRKRKAQAAA